MRPDAFRGSVSLYVTLIGVAAGVATLVALLGPAMGAAASTALAVPCVAYVVVRRRRRAQLDLGEVDAITFRYAMRHDLPRIVNLDKAVYHSSDVVPLQVKVEWYERNPQIFVCMFHGPSLAGYFSIIPLKADVLDRFIAGEIEESDFDADAVLTPSEALGCENLYFCSIAMDDSHPEMTYSLLGRAAKELERYRSQGAMRCVYAIAATAAGEDLLRRVGFDMIMAGSKRVDHNDLYSRSIDRVVCLRNYVERLAEA